MGRVMITCPETGRPVYTHLVMSWEEFEEAPLNEQRIDCPECHAVHVWTKADAFLDEEGGGD